MSKLDLTEQAEPDTPTSGRISLFAGTDGTMKYKDDTGFVTSLSAGTSGIGFDQLAAASPIVISTGTATMTWSHATSGVTGGTYGGSASIPQVVVNTYGHVTAVNTFALSVPTQGTYSPTITTVGTGITTFTAHVCNYLRVGNMVHVAGAMDIDPAHSVGGLSVTLGVTLPVASNFSAADQLGGVASDGASSLAISADATNDRANVNGLVNNIASRAYYFNFAYRVI